MELHEAMIDRLCVLLSKQRVYTRLKLRRGNGEVPWTVKKVGTGA